MWIVDRGHGFEHGMGDDAWMWIASGLVGLALVAGLALLAWKLLRGKSAPSEVGAAATPTRPPAEDILAERLARGEIEPDDYRTRLAALRAGEPGAAELTSKEQP